MGKHDRGIGTTVVAAVGVAMTLVSPDGDEGSAFEPSCNCTGYPGKLTLTVTFTLNNASQLAMHYHATVAGKNTVINFTNHNYFNLAGEDSFPGSAYGQFVQMNADRYLPTNATQIPTGVLAPVAGTPLGRAVSRVETCGSAARWVAASASETAV